MSAAVRPGIDPGRAAAGPLPAKREVGVFSWDRWGVGSILMIGAFLGAGVVLFVRWISTRGFFLLSIALLLFLGAGTFFVVKAVESIELVQFRGYDPVGKAGTVTALVAEGGAVSVRVDGLDWSAKSREALKVGDEVLVVGKDGLHLTVEKKPPQ